MKKILIVISILMMSIIAQAEDSLAQKFMIGADVGVPGGPEIKAGYRLTDYLEISASYRFFEYEKDVENIELDEGGSLSGKIKYDPTSAGLFLTVYPFGDDLKITAGRYFSAGTVTGTVSGNPKVKVDKSGTLESVDVNGTATLDIGNNVTYLSIGYNLGVTDRLHLEFTAGVQLIEEPSLDISLNLSRDNVDTLLGKLDNELGGGVADTITPAQQAQILDYLAKYNYDITEIAGAAASAGYTLPSDINVSKIEQEAKDDIKKAYETLPRWGKYRLLPSVTIGFVYYF